MEVDEAEPHYEVRGSGIPVLVVGGADEVTEIYRGIADRLADASVVVTYDRLSIPIFRVIAKRHR